MRRTAALTPYLLADDTCVEADPWVLADGSAVGVRMEHWDPETSIQLHRSIRFDREILLRSTQISEVEDLAATTVWRSDRTRFRGAGEPIRLDGSGEFTISISVPGSRAGGVLTVETVFIRTAQGSNTSPIAASRPGSIVWRDVHRITLEGSASRFPVTVIDFSGIPGVADDAPWTLEWSPLDLDQPVLGAMRLLVNSNNPTVVGAAGGARDPESERIVSMIRFDIARSLVREALSSEELLDGETEYEDDTIGRMLLDLLERYWPGVEARSLAQRATEVPYRIEAQIQASTDLLAP